MSSLVSGSKLTESLTLVRVLGEGAMGTVWAAEHRALGSLVAVKVMHADLARRSPSLVRRFTIEAQAAAQVRHPHIVQVLDHGTTEDGLVWISMELLEGESLRTVLERPVTTAFACAVIRQVASAIGKAHAAGIVHRDLKPENLQVTEVGSEPYVKVLDFGIAKAVAADGNRNMTVAGSVFGTPAYMSPEQLMSSRDVDARADLWALSVVAYELLTGYPPFEGDTTSAVAVSVTKGNYTPASALDLRWGAEIDGWFERAFSEDISRRFATAGELLSTFLEAVSATERRSRVSRLDVSSSSGPSGADAPASDTAKRLRPRARTSEPPRVFDDSASGAWEGAPALGGEGPARSAKLEDEPFDADAIEDEVLRSIAPRRPAWVSSPADVDGDDVDGDPDEAESLPLIRSRVVPAMLLGGLGVLVVIILVAWFKGSGAEVAATVASASSRIAVPAPVATAAPTGARSATGKYEPRSRVPGIPRGSGVSTDPSKGSARGSSSSGVPSTRAGESRALREPAGRASSAQGSSADAPARRKPAPVMVPDGPI